MKDNHINIHKLETRIKESEKQVRLLKMANESREPYGPIKREQVIPDLDSSVGTKSFDEIVRSIFSEYTSTEGTSHDDT